MSVVEPVFDGTGELEVGYFNRTGMIVPYVETPINLKIIECVDWIVVGPGPRIDSRFKSIRDMVEKMGLNIQVRPSDIPFSRV